MSQVLRNPNTRAFMSRVTAAAENAFLALLVVYLLYLYSYNSTYLFFISRGEAWLLHFARVLLFVMASMGGIRVGAHMLAVGKWNWKLIPALALSFLYIGAYYSSKSIFLLFLPVLTVTFIDMDYRKVVKVAVVMGVAFLAASYVGVFGGIIDNLVYFRDGYLRSSWGFGYPTDMASFLLFMIGMAWIAWRELPDELILLATLFCLWISYAYAASRTAVTCSVLFLLIIIYHMVEMRILQPKHLLRRSSEVLQKIATYTFPIMMLLFGLCLLLYIKKTPIGIRLNTILSQRLAYTTRIWRDLGIHPFGINFHAVGNGGNTIEPTTSYFLDCSYVLILIQYGWLLLLALGFLWCAMSHHARQKGDLRLLLMMTMIAVHAFSEHHFVEVMYNVLLPLIFARIPDSEIQPTGTKEALLSDVVATPSYFPEPTICSYWKKRKTWLIASMLIIFILCLIAPLQLSRIRTLLGISGYSGERVEKYQILSQMMTLLLLISLPIYTIMDSLFHYKKLSREEGFHTTVLCLLCLTGLLGIYLQESRTINNAEDDFTSMIRVDRKAMNLIVESAQGKVCVESVPELYKNQFDGIARTVFYGDDLARLKCGTVITDLSINRQRFTEMGFAFTPISRYHAVYSNDPSVIEALSAAGFIWTDYYSSSFEVDLQAMAASNDLKLTEAGTILMTGSEEKLENGPGLDIYGGNYVLICDMRITANEAINEDDVVCTVQVTDFYEGHLLKEKQIKRSEFNKKGALTSYTTFSTKKGSRNTEFRFIPADGQQIEILRIQYQKVSN